MASPGRTPARGMTASAAIRTSRAAVAPAGAQSCHDGQVPDATPPPDTRRDRRWTAAEARNIPLRAILAAVAVVVAVYMAGKLIYRLRDILLLMIVAGFVAVLLNPLVLAVQRWGVRRRGLAVAIVTLWGLLVFAGLAIAFGYPLANGISHLADDLPSYVSQVQHGKGWLGHLVRRYHVQAWVQSNAPKLTSLGQGLAKPALTLGKGAISLVIALLTIFVLVLLLLLEGPKMRTGLLGLMSPARAERYSRVAHEVNRSVTGYMLGNFLTSLIAGIVVFVTLLLLGVPFPFLWALWVALVDFLPMVGGALAGIPTVRVNPLLVLVSILVGASIGSWIGGIFGAFVAALLAIPAAGAIQVMIREVWQTTAPDRPAEAASPPAEPGQPSAGAAASTADIP